MVDLGCGDGRHARLMKELGAANVTGVDVSEEMIALARKSSSESNVDFFVADGKNLPMESGSVDIVVSNFVLHHFEDIGEVFQEIRRVLKEGGYFVGTFNITDVDPSFEYLYNQPMPIRLGEQGSTLVVQNLIKSRTEIATAIHEASFEVIKEEELDHPNAVVDDAFPQKANIHKHATLFILRK